jgi:hypothetical protein
MIKPTFRVPPGERSPIINACGEIASIYANAYSDEDTQFAYGRSRASEHGALQQISFIPGIGRLTQATEAGYAFRMLWTHQVLITAEDPGKVHRLFQRFCVALAASPLTNFQPRDQDETFEELSERDGESGMNLRGVTRVIEVVFREDIPIDDPGVVVIDEAQHQCDWVVDAEALVQQALEAADFPEEDDPDNVVVTAPE